MADQYKYLDSFINAQRANGKYSFTTDGLLVKLVYFRECIKKFPVTPQNQEAITRVRKLGFLCDCLTHIWINEHHSCQFLCERPNEIRL
ncbi:hypothetical protein [Lunatibacter salilacus]|uniref:hypothetical protein n=1 Tax=Lunatibacter salilacus TaxID=2483804 RepID=UPI00131AE75A|nr:hypothetical protein [Lunatibacter salilacus]